MPQVSVIMAFHRVTPFLRPAVESVLGQTLTDLELVLVDNGTGAGLAALGESGKDPRIRLVTHATNLGIAAAHNAALAQARGEFTALLDYDDIARPHRFERQVAMLRANPAWGLVNARVEVIDSADRVVEEDFCVADPSSQKAYSEIAAPVVTPVFTGRREVFERFHYREEFTFTADFDFLTRAAEAVAFGHVPEVLLGYRRHPAQTTELQARRIAFERCVVRLLAARRRAGRPEGEDWRALLQSGAEATEDRSELLLHFAHQFLREGFGMQAACHARRSFAARRTPARLLSALAVAFRAWRASGGQRGMVANMFLRGPVRTLVRGRRTGD